MDKILKILELLGTLETTKDLAEKVVIEKQLKELRSEVDTKELDKKPLVAESKKYRERAQKAEARLKLVTDKLEIEAPEDDDELEELLDGLKVAPGKELGEKDKMISKLTKQVKTLQESWDADKVEKQNQAQKNRELERDRQIAELLDTSKAKPNFKKFLRSEISELMEFDEDDNKWKFKEGKEPEAVITGLKNSSPDFFGEPVKKGAGTGAPSSDNAGEKPRMSSVVTGLAKKE